MKNQKPFSDIEIENALEIIRNYYQMKSTPLIDIAGVASLAKTIAWCERNDRLNHRLKKLMSQLKYYNNNSRKSYHNFVFTSLFDQNFLNFIMQDDEILAKIITELRTGRRGDHANEVRGIKIIILELYQEFKDFIQWTYLYSKEEDLDAALAFIRHKFEMKAKGKQFREVNFDILKLYSMIEKLHFVLNSLFRIKGIGLNDPYRKIRNAIAHSSNIPKLENENVSILESKTEVLSRKKMPNLLKKSKEVSIISEDFELIKRELICWGALLIQLFSITTNWHSMNLLILS